ncbi:class I SAM-dependent methyltransferase [Maritimibacter sp.]|uniref:class I SAM-dependent methyltransferase n=1 Tax=Maritimibacter sp. TaxID=2003363 RepID=UPI00338DE410
MTGIDFSDEMLAKARAKVRDMDLNHVLDLRQMDARALDFSDASFDTVVAMRAFGGAGPREGHVEIARVQTRWARRHHQPLQSATTACWRWSNGSPHRCQCPRLALGF